MINHLIEIVIGFSSGLVVGTGFVAFLTVLGIIPRLVQLSKTDTLVKPFEAGVILGALFGTYLSFTGFAFHVSTLFVLIWGTFHGVFIGMLAAALTEVLNVFPLLAKRVGLESHILWFLMAIVFGKIFGSLFQWLVFVK
ncbi:stage V sporulation protein AB [Aquibacillus koreensis]|uniref:Stage V sporulation protein AB n=1 Tax=Aquibacillus koreensis TaxID=279446 RepID=A0A9X3WH40_9BACI|nr:stage V sporulation protein AB [Aquibacillus koreensis]MCT2537442.1 stage V sporulation protein AB [Aquibacillus koreensis]MDC3418888.1 stage V sporulation protein AB [Aquibacillus koreensis]